MTDQAQQTDTAQAAQAALTNTDPQTRRVWLVEHPTHQYVENVKALARQAGLEVVDIAVASAAEFDRATAFPPKLTLRGAVAMEPVTAATDQAGAADGNGQDAGAAAPGAVGQGVGTVDQAGLGGVAAATAADAAKGQDDGGNASGEIASAVPANSGKQKKTAQQ